MHQIGMHQIRKGRCQARHANAATYTLPRYNVGQADGRAEGKGRRRLAAGGRKAAKGSGPRKSRQAAGGGGRAGGGTGGPADQTPTARKCQGLRSARSAVGPEGSHRGRWACTYTALLAFARRRGSGQIQASECMPGTSTSHRAKEGAQGAAQGNGQSRQTSLHQAPQGGEVEPCQPTTARTKDGQTPLQGQHEFSVASGQKGDYPGRLQKSMEILKKTRKTTEIQ